MFIFTPPLEIVLIVIAIYGGSRITLTCVTPT